MSNKLIHYVNDLPIKQKILWLFVGGILLPIIVLLLFFMHQIRTDLTNRETVLVEGELARIQINLLTAVTTAEQLANTYFADQDLAWALETYSENDMNDFSLIRGLDRRIQANLSVHPYIDALDIYTDNTSIFPTTYLHHLDESVQSKVWYQQYQQADQNTFIGFEGANIFLVRRLNVLKYENQNVMRVCLPGTMMQGFLDSEILTKETTKLYLLNPDGKVVLSNALEIPEDLSQINIQSQYHIYESNYTSEVLLDGWTLRAYHSRNAYQKMMTERLLFLLLLLVAVMLLSLLLFYALGNALITRLETIAAVMDHTQTGSLKMIETDMGHDEIGITAKSYNQMVHSIQNLMQDNQIANADLIQTNAALRQSIAQVDRQNQEIHDLVYQDQMTGLMNRFGILSHLNQLMTSRKTTQGLAIFLLDLDNFKIINETHGHHIGDGVLGIVGKRLNSFQNKAIQIGRVGGDEFLVILSDTADEAVLENRIQLIMGSIHQPIMIGSMSFALTISVGISKYPMHAHDTHHLMMCSDIALNKAKTLGRNRHVFYEDSFYEAMRHQQNLQALIKTGMQQSRYVLHYQPYYDAKTKSMLGCEALIRWEQDFGLSIAPAELIHQVEVMGLIHEFGLWIFIEACLFAKRLNEKSSMPIHVSVNISALQLMHPRFAEQFLNTVKDLEVDPTYLTLEMTESILLASLEQGTATLETLIDAGFDIALDDFGTGYSSLKYFKELPIHTLKIDKSFIDHIVHNPYDQQLVEMVIQLAHNKKMKVIAEGIENEAQFALLESMDCDGIQGFWLSKPKSGNAILAMIEDREEDYVEV